MANRVLLVDDDADILAAIKRKFRKQFHIDTALSGKEGLKLVAANGPYDVIVSDFQMPEMHGIEFFSRVKKIAPHTIRIMLTGHADLPAVIQAINDGNVFRFLLKPCPTNALAEAITKGIEQYEEIVTHHNYINRTRTSLALAREVQNDLMPRTAPLVKGFDIAMRSISCEETGGDYYDFLTGDETWQEKVAVVIGDVSGHGIASTILMATARAFLRQRFATGGTAEDIVSDVNRHLTLDVNDSGQFMTLFYLMLDRPNRTLHWVRAGHDPAILYDPEKAGFEELSGDGIALGVDAQWQYKENTRSGLKEGQIIILGTDGIWEARDCKGRMFGKNSIYEIIGENTGAGAEEILEAIFEKLHRFRGGRPLEDDATLVIIKVTAS